MIRADLATAPGGLDSVAVFSPAASPRMAGGCLPARGSEGAPASFLPSWVSGILDSPVLKTPLRLRISGSGFMLGWRIGFRL